ncbi:proteasome component [Grosmannia clavigera kw1407]|uniref:Proteasome component n=1 Tax=Grosmannia clavigera (strain kw1407 / UAMH 11150) TaxID=655863 RepID=F0XQR1_GROCL|nr:proteasome component [Grosmannia clavigera kw1407]EFW99889.1 proteasome component [Grosmannia clavigera kw1407]
MATPSTEERELALVDKVDFRILNVANNEKKLQDLLSKFLVPLLLKGASEHASVRAKVATVAQRLKLFIAPPGIVLPVAALVQQFKITDSAVVRHLDIVFIQHSIGRLSDKERREVIPIILKGIANVNSSTPALFGILLQALPSLKIPPRGSTEDAAFQEAMGLTDPADAAYVADRFGDLFLLSRSHGALSNGRDSGYVDFFSFEQPDSWLCTGPNLAETRIRAVGFLVSGAFTDEQRYMASLYASGHKDSRVSTIGEELLKRSTVSLENKDIVAKLFKAHSLAPMSYRIRILNLLCKSAIAASSPAEILVLVKRDLRATSADADSYDREIRTSEGGLILMRLYTLIVSGGLELSKLHRALFEFINWVARMNSGKEFVIGRHLIACLQSYITSQGWPSPEQELKSMEKLRAQAYETIGMLTKGALLNFDEQLALAAWLFRSLSEDSVNSVVVNIDGALSSMTSIFWPKGKGPDREDDDIKLRKLLLKYIYQSDHEPFVRRSARHAAAKWANNCLPFSDPFARWIDILAAAGCPGERSDVVEEGLKGLDPWTYYSNDAGSLVLPKWEELVHTFFIVSPESLNEHEVIYMSSMEVGGSPFEKFSLEKMGAFPLAVDYCKRILFLTALPDFKVGPGWEQQIGTLVRTDKKSRDTIRKYLKSAPEQRLFELLYVALEGMIQEKPAIAEKCGECFVELASLSPRDCVSSLAGRAIELMALVKSNKKEIRSLGATAIGILGAHPANDDDSLEKLKATLVDTARQWRTAVGSELNATEGAFLALGHLLSRLVLYDSDRAKRFVLDASSLFPRPAEISSGSESFKDSLFDALSQMWTAGIYGNSAADTAAFVDVMSTQAKKANERCITALGRLAIAVGSDVASEEKDTETETEDDTTQLILGKLYDLYEVKQVEVHFAIGGAITAAVACWDSEVVELSLDVEEGEDVSFKRHKRPVRLAAALDKILKDSKTTKPSLLKASGIWLFSLIQNCSHLAEVQLRLRDCQTAFMRLLSARDELVQETASRGLALVYEKGDESLKGDLVRDLVASFTGSSTQLKVDDDTELFEAGALPTGEGKSVTSYRDIVNLANEVGDQTLIYKFMSLASNAATWSTRSAFGRFGLSNILSESEVDPKLYPKLFRYRFDPNPNVQRSMNDIWKALVKDSSAVIEAHFGAIMEDLLKSILGKEWRVREASCAAVADLVQGRPFVQYEKYYEEIWAKALKVLDDVKGSVREAALRLCITLSNTLVRQLEEGKQGGNAQAMMNEALPFLMSEKGIESGVEDVKIFATVTVLKIAKHGGKALRPYIAAMVPHLLGLLSTIEPQAFNYYYMRSGEDGKEKLDKMRSAMVSQSPISEAIDNCLRNVDGSVMEELAPGLETAMKTAVGMPTKIGCSRVLSTLATRHTTEFGPFAGRLLRQLEKQALDRNDEVSQSYAKAAAYVMRCAPDEARVHFVERFIELYFGSEDEHRRQKVADAVLALSKMSPDHFNALEGRLLPFAYVSSHDPDDYVRKASEEVWSKHAGSSLSVARYVPEIAELVRRSLETAQWALKHAGALTAADAVKAVLGASSLSGQVNEGHLRQLWPLYERGLALKTFAGKEALLAALPDFVAKSRALWMADSKMAAALRKIVLVEAKRNNAEYRVDAFQCLWKVAAERKDIDLWPEAVAIVRPHLEALLEEDTGKKDRMDLDSGKDGDSKKKEAAKQEQLVRQTAERALDVVARSYNRPGLEADAPAILTAIWTELEPFLNSDASVIVRRTTWYKAAEDLFEGAVKATEKAIEAGKPANNTSAMNLILAYLGSLDLRTADAGTEAQRSARAKAVKALVQAAKKGVFGPSGTDEALVNALAEIKTVLTAALASERALDVQKLLKEALTV